MIKKIKNALLWLGVFIAILGVQTVLRADPDIMTDLNTAVTAKVTSGVTLITALLILAFGFPVGFWIYGLFTKGLSKAK